MKFALKFIVVSSLLISFLIPLTSNAVTATPYLEKERLTYFFAGLDNDSGNTDTIIVVSYDINRNTLNFLHIPRDTYYNYSAKEGKINSIYNSYLNYSSSSMALEKTIAFFDKTLDVRFDGASIISIEVFRKFIDAIGGVRVKLPDDFEYYGQNIGLELSNGEFLLDGKSCEMFIRHRKSYLLGDLTRIDAQKKFISGLYDTIMNHTDYNNLVKAFALIKYDFSSNFSLFDFVLLLSKYASKFKNAELNFATLPGKAILYKGLSYYAVNKKGSQELIKNFLSDRSVFDKNNIFTLSTNDDFLRIYNSDEIKYKIYNTEDINKIKLH